MSRLTIVAYSLGWYPGSNRARVEVELDDGTRRPVPVESPAEFTALAALLDAVQDELRALSDELTGRHFVRQAPRHSLRTDWSTPWQVT